MLVDEPATRPGLGFHHYVSALADVISSSKPQFAIGVFGGWGSGKTTLMQAIQETLSNEERVVTVWFNAWRYEREPHLIVPLLDVVRESLEKRIADGADDSSSRTKKLAIAAGRAARAILKGTTLSTTVFGMGAEFAVGDIVDSLTSQGDDGAPPMPISFYHAAFTMLKSATDEFSQHGTSRIVVFIDDLDRCMPQNALTVLESMKLFFDLEGFVFIVGLDRNIVERAVSLKYGQVSESAAPTITGSEYLKKVFQVPFTLPRVDTAQLNGYIDGTLANAALSLEQYEDFDRNVRPHLEFISGNESVNPREIKRLLNAYTMQVKMLSGPLGGSLNPNVVLALQCMSFRPDWDELYETAIIDPFLFQQEVRSARAEPKRDVIWIASRRLTMPQDFLRYIDGLARPLLDVPDLSVYISAVESGRNTDSRLLEGHSAISRVRRELEVLPQEITADRYAEMLQEASEPGQRRRLAVNVSYRSTFASLERALASQAVGANSLTESLKRFDALMRQPPRLSETESFEAYHRRLVDWAEQAGRTLDTLDSELRGLRRQASIGANPSP